MKNQNGIGIIIFIILVVSPGAFWFFSPKPKPADNALPPIVEQKPAENPAIGTTTQSGKIDEHLTINNELRDVNFCGKTYKVKQVMIDGVDVVQRVAEILTKDLIPATLKIGPYGPNMDEWRTIENKNGEMEKGICENIQNRTVDGITNRTTIEIINVGKTPDLKIGPRNEELYGFVINQESFGVVTRTGDIYGSSSYEGTLIGPIGKLK